MADLFDVQRHDEPKLRLLMTLEQTPPRRRVHPGAIVHDYIEPQTRRFQIRAACGAWVKKDDEARQRTEGLPVTCARCREIRAEFDRLEI